MELCVTTDLVDIVERQSCGSEGRCVTRFHSFANCCIRYHMLIFSARECLVKSMNE